MKTRKQTITGLLLNTKHRDPGSMEKEGKLIQWGDADQLVLLPLESATGKIMKINMNPDFAKIIYSITNDVCWGALVEVETDGRHAVSIEILSDWLSALEIR